MSGAIQFIQTTPESLKEDINIGLKNQLSDFFKNQPGFDSEELLTKDEAAKFLKVTIQGLHNWTKKGKIPCYGIGAKIYFKKSEILESLIPLNK